jgi:hypothetical protein
VEEAENDFRLLHAHTAVALWGALEALVENLAATIIVHEPVYLTRTPITEIKISIAEFETLDREARARVIVGQLAARLRADSRKGVDRFESVLDVLNLSGPVDAATKRDLYELQQVRNVLVHRSGIADRRLVSACPWMDIASGDALKLDYSTYVRYRDAVHGYLRVLINRMRVRLGFGEYEERKE